VRANSNKETPVQTRQDDPEVLATSDTQLVGDPAGTQPIQPLEGGVTGDSNQGPAEEERPSFLILLLRALSAWGT
jgi:hypothetical protein